MITIYDSTQWAKIPNRNVNNETKRPWQNVNSLIFSYIFFLWAITIQYIHWLRISKLFVYFFARVNLPIVDIAAKMIKNGILLPKLFWPTVRKKIVLVIKKNFWDSRLKAENLLKFRDHFNHLFKKWKGKKYWDLETRRKS